MDVELDDDQPFALLAVDVRGPALQERAVLIEPAVRAKWYRVIAIIKRLCIFIVLFPLVDLFWNRHTVFKQEYFQFFYCCCLSGHVRQSIHTSYHQDGFSLF